MFYGAVVWDPYLIIAQIICLQCLYYLTLGLFLLIFVGSRVPRMSLVYLFDFASMTISTTTGWCVIISFLLTDIVSAGYLLYLAERLKKCPDFTATLHITHLIFCVIYGGWPSSTTWWIVNSVGFIVMTYIGARLCKIFEELPIPIARYRSSNVPATRHNFISIVWQRVCGSRRRGS